MLHARVAAAVASPRPGAASPRTASTQELAEHARQARIDTLAMTAAAGSGHPGGSFSMAEAVVCLYHDVLDVAPDRLDDPDRDVFILSTGHCAPGLYAVLAQRGFFSRDEFPRLRRLGGLLQGHADRKVPGVEMSTGSLGMGLGYGNGVAMAKRMDGRRGHVWVMVGDGELQEGNVWESMLSSAHRKLDNLTLLVDHNKIQIDGFVADVKGIEPLADKLAAFGFETRVVDGHDITALLDAFRWVPTVKGRPTALILDTIKGKGVSFMENQAEYHGRSLNAEEMALAQKELASKP
jgi:transketolase